MYNIFRIQYIAIWVTCLEYNIIYNNMYSIVYNYIQIEMHQQPAIVIMLLILLNHSSIDFYFYYTTAVYLRLFSVTLPRSKSKIRIVIPIKIFH